MYVGLLGPLEVRDDAGVSIDVAGARLRTVLTRLALDAGRPVSVAVLVDAVWGEHSPGDEANALQTLMSRLRRALGGAANVAQGPAGYRLDVEPGDVDVSRFERLAADGAAALREGDPNRAAELLTAALALWRGPALADGGESVQTRLTRLNDLRLAALVDRSEAELVLGRAAPLVAELEALATEHPLHERIAGLLVRALAASGRQAEALGAYERVRSVLADELGVDPSPALQQLHLAVLRGQFAEPERVLPVERRTNLKSQLTSFVGRTDEVARVAEALHGARLVTVLGPGGAGKTRLAAEAAAECVHTTADGVWLVELAPVLDPAEVPHTVLAMLGRRESSMLEQRIPRAPREALEQLVETLAARETLLVLDNCEHLLAAAASLAEDLLARCPRLRVLATSREPLGIMGETLVLLPPLGTPALGDSAAEALEYPSVRLFADRAAAVSPSFVVDADTVGPVVEIVRRLDGQPLAIELAAARLRSLPVAEIAARLSDRFRLLVGSRTAMPRHRTLRAVVEWSWDLLTPAERLLAERLAVFPAGVTPASATAVCADAAVPAADVPELLAGLVDRSLLQLYPSETARYRMLETIREFGSERLSERGELAAMRLAHAEHFADFAHDQVPRLRAAGQIEALRQVEAEHDNVLAALRELCDIGSTERAHELASALNGYWAVSGRHGEAATWLDVVLALPAPQSRGLRLEIEAAQLANSVAAVTNSFGEGTFPQERLAALADELVGVQDWDRPMLAVLAPIVLFVAQRHEEARLAMQHANEHPDPWVNATNASMAARFAENDGDLDAVRRSLERAGELYTSIGDRWGLASVLPLSAQLDIYASRLEEGCAKLLHSLELMAEFDVSHGDDQMFVEVRLADVLHRLGRPEEAEQHVATAWELATRTGAPEWLAITAALRGAIEAELGNLDVARDMQHEAERHIGPVTAAVSPLDQAVALIGALGANLDVRLGDRDAALARLHEVWPSAVKTRDRPIIATVGVAIAGTAVLAARHAEAAELLGLSARLRGADDPTSPTVAAVVAQAVDALGQASYDKYWSAGFDLGGAEAAPRMQTVLDSL
ncbi:BTAD domain-containing putative transcriptional regulator [Jatrophihabitans sp.]|uniref:BTAD domain-containing putative transcriptional regulator n=1 Tax=Jatrophihabitans sp. TaxID=1932789 RepID=UPI0030C72471|nr:transcriptional regulator, winged helix family [Jatrophihabitans sp.]